MRSGVLPWKACVFTFGNPRDYLDFRNAILYADTVAWVSTEIFIFPARFYFLLKSAAPEKAARLKALFNSRIEPQKVHADDLRTIVDEVVRETGPRHELTRALRHWGEVRHFQKELSASGIQNCVCRYLTSQDYEEMVSESYKTGKSNSEEMMEGVSALIAKAIDGARLVIEPKPPNAAEFTGTWDEPSPYEHQEPWSAYIAATQLMQALSKLLLTDVSSLPLDAIAEMRDRLQNTLDPMRAEMLRFTEDLRQAVDNDPHDPTLLAAEAENLIATRVEPVVREANAYAREMAEKKWRKLFTSAATAFGLTGAAFINHILMAKAVQKTLQTGALAFNASEDERTMPKATAQFVLEARGCIERISFE
jgi:hypothetical protein